MKYEKPEVFVLALAAAVIQGTGKGYNITPDGAMDPPNHTNSPAYEADE
jgi:hypothetical protein